MTLSLFNVHTHLPELIMYKGENAVPPRCFCLHTTFIFFNRKISFFRVEKFGCQLPDRDRISNVLKAVTYMAAI